MDGKIYETVTTNDPEAWALVSQHPKLRGSGLDELLRGVRSTKIFAPYFSHTFDSA